MTRRPRILVVGCGGSISSVRAGDGAIPTLDAAQLVAEVPELSTVAEIEARSFAVVPSAYQTLDDVLRLARILDAATGPGGDFDGAVVTHGTDTLEEVAFALDLVWRNAAPVVITGAMRNASLTSPDGPGNILAAVITAASPAAHGIGVLAVLNDEIHAAREVRKTHATSLAAFRSPTTGPLGFVTEGEARLLLSPRRTAALELPSEDAVAPPVALLTIAVGDDARLLGHVPSAGYRGLVLEAFGGGHLPGVVADSTALAEVTAAVPVVLASRTGAGEVLRSTYSGWSGSEVDLIGKGLIGAGSLGGPQARVLLTLLLMGDAGQAEIRNAFHVRGLGGTTSG